MVGIGVSGTAIYQGRRQRPNGVTRAAARATPELGQLSSSSAGGGAPASALSVTMGAAAEDLPSVMAAASYFAAAASKRSVVDVPMTRPRMPPPTSPGGRGGHTEPDLSAASESPALVQHSHQLPWSSAGGGADDDGSMSQRRALFTAATHDMMKAVVAPIAAASASHSAAGRSFTALVSTSVSAGAPEPCPDAIPVHADVTKLLAKAVFCYEILNDVAAAERKYVA